MVTGKFNNVSNCFFMVIYNDMLQNCFSKYWFLFVLSTFAAPAESAGKHETGGKGGKTCNRLDRWRGNADYRHLYVFSDLVFRLYFHLQYFD